MPHGQGHDAPEGEPDLTEIEAALGSLAPIPGRLDRDRVMYQAGRSSVRPVPNGRRAWMAVAASLGLVALGEGALLARRPPERVVERLIVVREPAPSSSPTVEVAATFPTPSPDLGPGLGARDRLVWQVIRYGLDGLPAPGPSAGADGDPSRQSLREELGKVLDLGDPS